MNNLDIIKFKQNLADVINASELPIEVKRLCLNEVISVVNIECQRVLAEEEKENVESVQRDNPDNSVPHNEAD